MFRNQAAGTSDTPKKMGKIKGARLNPVNNNDANAILSGTEDYWELTAEDAGNNILIPEIIVNGEKVQVGAQRKS